MPKTVEIFYAENTRDSFFYSKDSAIYSLADAKKALETPGAYTKAGEVEVELDPVKPWVALDSAFCKTQNFRESWCEPPKRSSSVGDIFKIDGKAYIVASCGFEDMETGEEA